jgi:hypothetical protein
VGFGGMSVGGIGPNRKQFGALLPYVDHLPHTHLPAKNAYCRGEPPHGAELADVLENLVALHGAETIAAVMVEPVAGSTGVLVPPVGYLKRLRDICTKHGILLIFDEVITGFGRLGANFGAERLGVVPDIMTMAKGLTNAAVPMGAVAVKNEIYDAIVTGTSAGIEFFHGYTYSGHPLAAAAAIATLELHRAEDLPGRARALEPYWQDAVHSLKGLPNVIDIRDVGLIGAVELAPRPGKPTQRALDVFRRCFDDGAILPAGEAFYRTGDVANRDQDGYLTYVGRADDVFKASDYRISPFELESVLIEHEAVAEAAVVPAPDAMRMAVPKAFIALAPGAVANTATMLSIFQHLRGRLSAFKRVRRLEVHELPKTISGKIRRVELRQLEEKRFAAGTRSAGEYREEDFPELRHG